MSKSSIKRMLKRCFSRHLTCFRRYLRNHRTIRNSPCFTYPKFSSSHLLKCCIAYAENGGFCVPLSSHHRPAAQKILSGSVYEPETIAFMSAHCGDGDIVHAGTYFGDFLPSLSRACASGAIVWAFEPNTENYRCAVITQNINGLRNVNLYNTGLGERSEQKSLIIRDVQGRSLGGASHLVEFATKEVCSLIEAARLVALDDVIPKERSVSLIQLDVEGFEQQALAGALSIIKQMRPIIILENLPNGMWLSEHILAIGYKIDGNVHGNSILLPTST